MYLLNSNLTVNWHMITGGTPPSVGSLDVTTVDPDGISTVDNGAISAGDYTPSTDVTIGNAAYSFTPDKLGLWKLQLTSGGIEFATHKILVSINDTLTKKLVTGL